MSNRNKEIENEVRKVIREFDFDKVHNVMKYLDWSWMDTFGVPSIADMVFHSLNHLTECCQKSLVRGGPFKVGTGGFEYEAEYDKEQDKFYMSISFVLTDWNNYD